MKVIVDNDDEDLFISVKLYKCRQCSIRFSSRASLNLHAHKKHGKTNGKWVNTPKTCKVEVQGGVLASGTGTCVQVCFPEMKVLLGRQRFKEIFVTTPAVGKREIFFTCEADSNFQKEKKMEYEEWRLETIDTLSIDGSPPKAVGDDKTLHLTIPYQTSFMFDVNGTRDDIHSILDIISGLKMTWMVMDAYLMRRVESYNSIINAGVRASYKLRPKLTTRFEFLSCAFGPVYERDQLPSDFEINKTYLPRFPLKDCVLIAPQYTCKHFYLAVFNFNNNHVRLFDSSWHFVPKDLRIQQVRNILNTLVVRLKEQTLDDTDYVVQMDWTIEWAGCAQQIDEYSCGIYAIQYAENEMKGKPEKSQKKLSKKDIAAVRTKIAFELLPTTYYGSQLLKAIST
ncbi:hypothetical protein Ocin01_03927 [Orchesella cincta]|uniref:C2H2-type domain-containing protein n=1 Tax=Orchesella cincta TaxID=48709 RepID=A0A1D2NBY1_ORCCI|nr:hypothetical protein Ocin01_03927 [Orchesella cincta]